MGRKIFKIPPKYIYKGKRSWTSQGEGNQSAHIFAVILLRFSAEILWSDIVTGEMSLHWIGYFLVGLVGALALVRMALRFFPRLGLLDFPERYGLVRDRIPYPGGIIFVLLGFGLIWIDARFLVLIPAILALGAISFLDDRKPLGIWPRLFVHLAVVLGLFWLGVRIETIGDPFHGTNLKLSAEISFALTICWIIGVQNALNWFDGLKGLSVGTAGIGFLFLSILGVVRPELFFDPAQQSILAANLFLSGLCLGGWWQFFRGKILLGDTGSQVLGFLLAVMSIFSGAKLGTTALILLLPILDTGFVMARRILVDKKSPLKGDKKHLHHNLARKFQEKPAVLILLGLSTLFGLAAVIFTGFAKFLALGIAILLSLAIMVWSYARNEELKKKR